MKRIAILLPVVATALLNTTAPARAFVSEEWTTDTPQVGSSKDECLLVARNCPESGNTLEQRIIKLQSEIAKGTDVYTNAELRVLINKLDETNRQYLELLNKESGGAM